MTSPKLVNETLPEFYGVGSLSVHEHIEQAITAFFSNGTIETSDLFALNNRLLLILKPFRNYQLVSQVGKNGETFQVVD